MSILERRPNLSLWIMAAVAGYLASGESQADSIPTSEPLFYAGTLIDDGVPVEGARNIVLGFFDDALASNTPLCVTDAQSTTVINGRFRIALNATCLDVVRVQPDVWVQVKVDGASLGLSKLGAVPYAVEAERAAKAPGTVGLGSVISHMPHLTGASSIAEMQALGFALADGTTPSSQGITGAVLVGATPDLNGQRLFLRGGPAVESGTLQDDATARNGLSLASNDPGHNHAQNSHNHSQQAHSHSSLPHRHASRVSDGNGFCNNNNSDVPLMGNTANWDNASTSDQGCGYFTSSISAPISSTTASNNATTAANQSNTTGITVTLGAGNSETRPANMSVVWMIRVR